MGQVKRRSKRRLSLVVGGSGDGCSHLMDVALSPLDDCGGGEADFSRGSFSNKVVDACHVLRT